MKEPDEIKIPIDGIQFTHLAYDTVRRSVWVTDGHDMVNFHIEEEVDALIAALHKAKELAQ